MTAQGTFVIKRRRTRRRFAASSLAPVSLFRIEHPPQWQGFSTASGLFPIRGFVDRSAVRYWLTCLYNLTSIAANARRKFPGDDLFLRAALGLRPPTRTSSRFFYKPSRNLKLSEKLDEGEARHEGADRGKSAMGGSDGRALHSSPLTLATIRERDEARDQGSQGNRHFQRRYGSQGVEKRIRRARPGGSAKKIFTAVLRPWRIRRPWRTLGAFAEGVVFLSDPKKYDLGRVGRYTPNQKARDRWRSFGERHSDRTKILFAAIKYLDQPAPRAKALSMTSIIWAGRRRFVPWAAIASRKINVRVGLARHGAPC